MINVVYPIAPEPKCQHWQLVAEEKSPLDSKESCYVVSFLVLCVPQKITELCVQEELLPTFTHFHIHVKVNYYLITRRAPTHMQP